MTRRASPSAVAKHRDGERTAWERARAREKEKESESHATGMATGMDGWREGGREREGERERERERKQCDGAGPWPHGKTRDVRRVTTPE